MLALQDNEHKSIFKKLNILYDIKVAGERNPEIVEQLNFVLSIVPRHFPHEENEMPVKNFSGYAAHKTEHLNLIVTCTALQLKIEAGELELTERICQLIKNMR